MLTPGETYDAAARDYPYVERLRALDAGPDHDAATRPGPHRVID